jgi:hypothetical protein
LQVVEQTLNPTWDELLIIPSVTIYGSTQDISTNPPAVVIELFDYDRVVSLFCYFLKEILLTIFVFQTKREFIGQVIAHPIVKLAKDKYTKPKFPPTLQWYQVFRGTEAAGELLAAFELLEVSYFYFLTLHFFKIDFCRI